MEIEIIYEMVEGLKDHQIGARHVVRQAHACIGSVLAQDQADVHSSSKL